MIDNSLIFDGALVAGGGVTGDAITATRVSTNVLDLLAARDLGAGAVLGLHVDITEAFATLTSLQIDVEVCATVGGTYKQLALSPVIPLAQLIIGTPIFRYGVPLNQVLNATAGVLAAPGRYMQLKYTVAGSNATAGKVFAYLNPINDRTQFTVYPANYSALVASGEL